MAGFGAVTAAWPLLPQILTLAGAAFLLVYGAMRLRAAWRGEEAMRVGGASGSLKATLAAAAAFTWLNPHVYLDTLGLVGAVSTGFPALPAKTAFGVGAVLASFVFFFSLGYGARLLAPLMQSARAWRVLDLGIALVMWALAGKLLVS